MKSVTTSGLICVKDKLNIEYSVCKIDYIINEDDTYKFVFTPYYDVIDLLGSDIFQGIPGLNLDLRKEEYIRENMRPVFISERVPSEKREGYRDFLKKVGMDYMDPVEYLIRTDYKYSGDNFYVIRYKEREKVFLDNVLSKCNSFGTIKVIVDNISHGNDVYLDNGININDKKVFETLLYIYKKSIKELKEQQQNGISDAKKDNKYKGRKPIDIDVLLFREKINLIDRGLLTTEELITEMDISRSTFYRLKNKYKSIKEYKRV